MSLNSEEKYLIAADFLTEPWETTVDQDAAEAGIPPEDWPEEKRILFEIARSVGEEAAAAYFDGLTS